MGDNRKHRDHIPLKTKVNSIGFTNLNRKKAYSHKAQAKHTACAYIVTNVCKLDWVLNPQYIFLPTKMCPSIKIQELIFCNVWFLVFGTNSGAWYFEFFRHSFSVQAAVQYICTNAPTAVISAI